MSLLPPSADEDRPSLPTEDGELDELVRLLVRKVKTEIHTALPAVVSAFVPRVPGVMPACVDLQPSFMAVYFGARGQEIPKPLPKVYRAVLGCFKSGGFRMTARPNPGDMGWIIVSERSLEKWYASGGAPVDPVFQHTHNVGDALFLPMGAAEPGGLEVPEEGLSISTDVPDTPVQPGEILMTPTGQITIRSAVSVGLEAPMVNLQTGAALGTFLTALHAAITAWTPVAQDGGAALKVALATWLALQAPGPP
jgi:hypothetical protein